MITTTMTTTQSKLSSKLSSISIASKHRRMILWLSLLLSILSAQLKQCHAHQVVCTYQRGHIQSLDEHGNVQENVTHACVLRDGTTFTLLPALLQQIDQQLTSQRTQLSLNDILVKNDIIVQAKLGVVIEGFDFLTDVPATGTKSLLLVRVIATSPTDDITISPRVSQTKLTTNFFRNDDYMYAPQETTFAQQMNDCSAGQLNFIPGHNDNGVVDLQVSMALKDVKMTPTIAGELVNAFANTIADPDDYNHLLFCLPFGMTEYFVAFAVDNSNLSFFQDPWCQYLTAGMHEVGHNYFLAHSNDETRGAYKDHTCVMGASFSMERGPRMCFNGQKLWALNWYSDKRTTVDPVQNGPWNGQLAAFVDHANIPSNSLTQVVIIQVGNLYLVYNRGKSYNAEVIEKRNLVTIVRATDTDKSILQSQSSMMAGLNAEQGSNTFTRTITTASGTTTQITIEICSVVDGGNYDFAELSITAAGQDSMCDITNQAPLDPSQSEGQCSDSVCYDIPCCQDSQCFNGRCRARNQTPQDKENMKLGRSKCRGGGANGCDNNGRRRARQRGLRGETHSADNAEQQTTNQTILPKV